MKQMNGVVTGVVESFADPQGQGRIQLKFPWLSDTQVSSWAPVAAALGGKKRGAFLMPEIGDEVLVAFEHGDFDHPFIVGFLWNGVAVPPETTNENRVIITPGGHSLRFQDGQGAQKVILQSQGGLTITLDDTVPSITIQGAGRMITMAGGMITFN
jgi:uncharacterized protein involved in type VI secretion and phage assembly